ncbi:Uncharacterized protein HZ326_16414 [Fusarium oxysporum f. sp. albedinis]|nr:Uncharacterized protein HZ326_16414 [Fusarium oxysporum f. sp. albedinis]
MGSGAIIETESLSDLLRRLDARNRENVALAGLGFRTSTDIFEATHSHPAPADLGIWTSANILKALNGKKGQKSGDMRYRRRHYLHWKLGIMSSG